MGERGFGRFEKVIMAQAWLKLFDFVRGFPAKLILNEGESIYFLNLIKNSVVKYKYADMPYFLD